MPPKPNLPNAIAVPTTTTSASKQLPRDSSLLKPAQMEQCVTPIRAKRSTKKGAKFPQIFAGQTFIFVPNDKRAVPRKRRIEKAVLHGATWARAWTPSVTHVIVEDNQKVEDYVKFTRQQGLPKDVALVMHTWLTESMGFKEMRQSAASRFQVDFAYNLITQTNSPEESFDDSTRASSSPIGV